METNRKSQKFSPFEKILAEKHGVCVHPTYASEITIIFTLFHKTENRECGNKRWKKMHNNIGCQLPYI